MIVSMCWAEASSPEVSHCQELEAVDSLHCRPIDEDRFMETWLPFLTVNNQLPDLANTESKIVVLASFR